MVDAVGVHQLPQPPRELALAATHPRLGRERLERALRCACGAADCGNLVGVLDGTQGLDLPRRRHEVEAASTQCLDVHVGQDVGFEAEPTLESLSHVDQKHPLAFSDAYGAGLVNAGAAVGS